MPTAKKIVEKKDTGVIVGIVGAVGILAALLIPDGIEKVAFEAAFNANVDTLCVKGELARLPEVTDKLALTTDSIKPAYKKIYPAIVTRDSTGAIIKTIKADTVQVAAAPCLAGFNENGTADYEIAAIVPSGSSLRIAYILDGKEINSQLIEPKTAEWLISARARASLHSGK